MVHIDKEACIGCGSCTAICEEVFEMTDEGKAKIINPKDCPCIDEAIEACPVDCIKK